MGEYCYEEKDTRICLLALRKGNKEKECLEDPSLGRKKNEACWGGRPQLLKRQRHTSLSV